MLSTEPASVLSLISIIWLVVMTSLFFRIFRHYQRLTKNTKSGNLHKILEKILSSQSSQQTDIAKLTRKIGHIEDLSELNIQKIGLVRFNPFAQTGGDHSFSLAVLDNTDTGFVITSLHSREITRFYIKPVKESKSKYQLSKEEKFAIKKSSRNKVD